jgi:hypothetical protein
MNPKQTERQRVIDVRKRRHAALNTYINQHGGWLTSIPGDAIMRFESALGSSLPGALRANGYQVSMIGSTMRIVPNAHADIMQTEVYELALPAGAAR